MTLGKYGVFEDLRCLILNDIGCFLMAKKEFDIALEYFQISFDICLKYKFEFILSITLMNLGILYEHVGR